MALRIGELPFFAQLLICLLVFAGVVLAGEFYGPFVADKKVVESNLETEVSKLRGVVNQLQDAKKRHADLQTGLKSLEEQLERTKEVVPAEKQTDQFMLMVQSSARSGGITLRRLTARGVVYKDFYAEMPFEIEYDGAYYNLVNFFRQLGQSSRIINASALKLDGVEARRGRFEYAPGTTIAGTCTVTTFFTPSREELAAAAPPTRPGARGAPAQPRR